MDEREKPVVWLEGEVKTPPFSREARIEAGVLLKRLGSSQSRVAKLESGAAGASLDLMFRALLATGATTDDIAREIRPKRRSAA